jgi:hypothetical protein
VESEWGELNYSSEFGVLKTICGRRESSAIVCEAEICLGERRVKRGHGGE